MARDLWQCVPHHRTAVARRGPQRASKPCKLCMHQPDHAGTSASGVQPFWGKKEQPSDRCPLQCSCFVGLYGRHSDAAEGLAFPSQLSRRLVPSSAGFRMGEGNPSIAQGEMEPMGAMPSAKPSATQNTLPGAPKAAATLRAMTELELIEFSAKCERLVQHAVHERSLVAVSGLTRVAKAEQTEQSQPYSLPKALWRHFKPTDMQHIIVSLCFLLISFRAP